MTCRKASKLHSRLNEWPGTTSAWWDAVSANRCSSDLHFCRAMEQVYVGVTTLACGNSSLPACSSCSTIDSISAAGRQAGRQACRQQAGPNMCTCKVGTLNSESLQLPTTQSKTIYIYILFHTFLQSQFLHIPVEALLLASGSNVQSCSLT